MSRLRVAAAFGAGVLAASIAATVCAQTLQPPELRMLHANIPSLPVYPSTARAQHREGRLLISFRLDHDGNTLAAKIVQAEADELLQARALELLQGTRYDTGSFSIDSRTMFYVTVIYCMDHCEEFAEYPKSNSLMKFTAIPYPGH